VLAQRTGKGVGDEIVLDTATGSRKVRIAALAIDYMVGGYIVYMKSDLADNLYGKGGAAAFLIRARPDAREAVRAKLEGIVEKNGLMLHSYAELSEEVDRIMNGVVGSLWGLSVVGFVVAAMGIANTLTMNVLEQTRELALLRVVAMTRRQIRRLIVAQAAIIGLIGLALGLVAGVMTAFVISYSSMPLLGYPSEFAIQPWLLVSCFAGGMLLVLGTAWLPAERAARLDLIIALQYE
jgi:putative ABC transport system permease protein